MRRHQRSVDPEVLKAFEISKREARQHARAELKRSWQQFGRLMKPAKQTEQAAGAEILLKPLSNLFKTLVGFAPADLRQNPGTVGRGIISRLKTVKILMEGVTSDDPAKQAAARDRMRAIREALKAQGIETNDSLNDLIDNLAVSYRESGKQQELAKSIPAVEFLAQELEQAFEGAAKSRWHGAVEVGKQVLRPELTEADINTQSRDEA